jgi:SAM-dependent methyltransferase
MLPGRLNMDCHQRELEIALDPSHPARAMPLIIPSKHMRILDVGCGMGQTLLAAQLSRNIEAYGVDRDLAAIVAGHRIAPSNITLLCAAGENLPFANGYFDLVISRGALPYMKITKAVLEISRVLKNGGDFWLSLHPASLVLSKAEHAAYSGNLKAILSSIFVLLNGILFNCFGAQISVLGCQESFQTVGGIAKVMKSAGLTFIPLQERTQFIIQGHKMSDKDLVSRSDAFASPHLRPSEGHRRPLSA